MIQHKEISSYTERYVPLEKLHNGEDLEPFFKELPLKERDLAIPDKNSVISQYIGDLYVHYNVNGYIQKESVFLPMITKKGFDSTIGEHVERGVAGAVYYVQDSSIAEKSRVYKIVNFLNVCTGNDLQAQKIASDCGVSPHFYGAALCQVTDKRPVCYQMIWELDFIESTSTGQLDSDYNKKVLQKVQMLYERCVLQMDLKEENILINKENRLFIIDYNLARTFSNTDECMEYAWGRRTRETDFLKEVVIEVLESQYKQKIEDVDRKQLVERFFCWPPLKENLILWFSKLCINNSKNLDKMREYGLKDLKKKYFPEEQETLTHLLKQWLTAEKIFVHEKKMFYL
jgi:Protein kinase domain